MIKNNTIEVKCSLLSIVSVERFKGKVLVLTHQDFQSDL